MARLKLSDLSNLENTTEIEKVSNTKQEVITSSKMVIEIVNGLVSQYNSDLDDYIDGISDVILNSSERLTDYDIERMVLKLPLFIYYAGSGLEDLGAQTDVAKAKRAEMFNDAFINANGTINDKNSQAEQLVLNETIVEVAFGRAYKKLKSKLDTAARLHDSVKKIMNKRQSDNELSRGILNARREED